MERSTIFHGKIHYKWQFSIALLNYQRVAFLIPNSRLVDSCSQFENQETSVLTHNPVRILQTTLGEIEQTIFVGKYGRYPLVN
jgi:hypothetical protein